MKTKLAATLIVLVATFVSIELTALGQVVSHSKPTVDSTISHIFHEIVGRIPTTPELTFWKNVARTNEAKGLDVKIDTLIMDWFVAPAQMGERLAAIDRVYNLYFQRPAHEDERAKTEKLVSSKRIKSAAIIGIIVADLVVTQITDVAGDPRAINVTIKNLSSISTSGESRIGLRIYTGAKCIGAAPIVGKLEVPPIAAQKSVVIQLKSTEVLQQSNSHRHGYGIIIDAGYKNYEPQAQADNNDRCIPALIIGTDEVTDQTPNIPVPGKPHTHSATPKPKNP